MVNSSGTKAPKPWDESVWKTLTTNTLIKVGWGIGIGASGVLLFRSPRIRTFWLGACTGAGGGYAWHENSVFLSSGTVPSFSSLPELLKNMRSEIPSFFRID